MTPDEQCAILERFFAAIQAADIDTVSATYHPDCAIWHNNDNVTQTVAENLPVLSWVSRNVKGVRYEEIRRTPTDDGRILQQHVLRGTARNGRDLEVFACIIFAFDEQGRITRLEEYLDSGQVAVLRE